MSGFIWSLVRFVFAFCIALSSGKHFRGGTVSWYPTKNYDDLTPEITFVFRLGWQYSYYQNRRPNETISWRCTSGCSDRFTKEFQLMANDSQCDWLWGGNSFTVRMYRQTRDFAVEYSSLGYADVMVLPGNRLVRVEVGGKTGIRSDTKLPNSSPVTNMFPVITIHNTNSSIKIPVTDIDNDIVKCFFKTDSSDLRNIITLDQDNCELIFVRREPALVGYLAIDLVIKDFPRSTINLHGLKHTPSDFMSFVPLQFFIEFVNNPSPSSPYGLSPCNYLKPTYETNVNSKLVLGPISIHMPTGKPNLVMLGPSGMTEKVKRKIKGGIFNKTVNWKPKKDQIGLFVVCFTVANANPTGHIGDNFLCTSILVKDSCFPNRCNNGGHCVGVKKRFKCQCPISFTGLRCETETVECERGSCWNSGYCDEGASRRCACVTGFQGKHCYNDNDECAAGACAENAICTNTVGSFKCVCKHGFSGDALEHCTGRCESEIITTPNGTFTFPSSWVELLVLSEEVCPDSNRSMASVRCAQYTDTNGTTNFKFDRRSFYYTPCDVTIEGLESELNSSTTSSETVEKVVSNLGILTSAGTNRSSDKKATEMLQRISKLSVATNVEVLITFANVASNLIDKLAGNRKHIQSREPHSVDAAFRERANWIQKNCLITSVLEIGRTTQLSNTTTSVLVDTARISVEIINLVHNDHADTSDNAGTSNSSNSITLSPKVYTDAAKGIKTTPVSLTIPKSVYKQKQVTCDKNQLCRGDSATSGVRASLVVHKSGTKEQQSSMDKHPNEIVAVELSSINTSSLPDPITLTFRKKKPDNTSSSDDLDLRCVFWDEYTWAWSSRGCWLRSSDENETICECNHMTTFALLVNIAENAPDETILSIVSNIGCILSSVCLVLTIIIHLSITQLRNRRPTPIMVNLCCNLLITYLIFFFGIQRTEVDIVCHVVAITLHWSLLSAWCWMAVYNYSMYLAFVKVFNYIRKHFWLTVALFAYGLPTLIVAVSVGYFMFYVDKNNGKEGETSYRMANLCWLRDDALYYTFLAPVGVLLLYNLVVYFLVLRKITWNRTEIQSTIKKTSTTHELLLGISLAACLGLPWIFGYFMLVSTDYYFQTIMSWLFTAFNAFQGFSIFIISCVRQNHVRKLWVRYLVRSKIYKNITNKPVEKGNPVNSKVSPTMSSRLTTRRNIK